MRPGPLIATLAFVLLGAAALVLSFMAMPTRLKVGVGPDDRDHARMMAAFARKLQDDRAPVRLTLVRKQTFAELARALDAGEVDLAVVRSTAMPRQGLTVAVLHELPIVFVVVGPTRLNTLADLRQRRVGVLRGTPENLELFDNVLRLAGINPAQVTKVPLEPDNMAAAIDQKQVDAIANVEQAHAAGPGRWRDAHGAHQFRLGRHFLVADPLCGDVVIAGDQFVEAGFGRVAIKGNAGEIEIDARLGRVNGIARRENAGQSRADQMQRRVVAHVQMAARPVERDRHVFAHGG